LKFPTCCITFTSEKNEHIILQEDLMKKRITLEGNAASKKCSTHLLEVWVNLPNQNYLDKFVNLPPFCSKGCVIEEFYGLSSVLAIDSA